MEDFLDQGRREQIDSRKKMGLVQTDRFLSGWDPIVSESLGQKSLEELPIQNKYIG